MMKVSQEIQSSWGVEIQRKKKKKKEEEKKKKKKKKNHVALFFFACFCFFSLSRQVFLFCFFSLRRGDQGSTFGGGSG